MNILINAVSISEGGGLVVLTNLLVELCHLSPQITWYVVADQAVLDCIPKVAQIKPLPYAWSQKKPIQQIHWYEIELPKLLVKLQAKVCFSLTNFLPKRRLSCPSLLLVHNAGYFSKQFQQLYWQWNSNWLRRFLWQRKKNWLKRSIQQATLVTVQTQALAENISTQLGIAKEKLLVIPHGKGLLKKPIVEAKGYPVAATLWRVGYITKFGVQKDFITAFKAVAILKKRDIAIKLILTLNPADPDCVKILKYISQYDIADCIENHGEVSGASELEKIYASLQLFIFPSLCESFGFTLVEAMGAGLPVVIADTASNCEVAGAAAQLFSMQDAKQLADQIQKLITDSHHYNMAAQASAERAQYFCWQNTARSVLKAIHDLDNKNEQ
jgi:glycosyltransferase involved in cell wall biosynthesis